MKSFYALVALSLLPVGLSIAQTSPATQSTTKPATTNHSSVKPPATRPAATDAQTTTVPAATASPNRQQELYDQYHGISKKPTGPASTATQEASPAGTQPRTGAADSPQPAVTATASRPERPTAEGNTSGVRIGVRGGVTYLVYTEKDAAVDPALGFVGGLTFNFGAGALSFQPEINYARYSAKGAGIAAGFTAASDLIEVPLFLKIASGTYDGTRFFLNVGPYGTYIASVSLNGKKLALDGNEGRISYGAAAGIGAALKAGPGHLTVEVRGYYQLGDNNKPSGGTLTTIPAQATLGYVFPLGGR